MEYIEYLEEVYHMNIDSPEVILEATAQATEILDTDYKKADISEIVTEYLHLNSEEKQLLKSLLYKYESLFDGTLGTWKTEPVSLELKDNGKSFIAIRIKFHVCINKSLERKFNA